MPRKKPSDRFLRVDGITHLMRKDVAMWVSECGEEGRFPTEFRRSNCSGPVNCLSCIAEETAPSEDIRNDMRAWNSAVEASE